MMIKKLGISAVAAVAFATLAGPAQAASLSCPAVLAGAQDNTYTVSNAGTTRPVDCVWGPTNTNIGQGNPANDAFLTGTGVNDIGNTLFAPTEAAANDERFNLTWALIGSTQGWSNGPTQSVSGLTFSNSTNTSTDFTINPALTGGSYTAYALGLKDGGNPWWGVFLLSNLNGGLTGTASMTGGSFSHFVLYGTTTPGGGQPDVPPTPAPEPATLALLGLGLLGAGVARRRK